MKLKSGIYTVRCVHGSTHSNQLIECFKPFFGGNHYCRKAYAFFVFRIINIYKVHCKVTAETRAMSQVDKFKAAARDLDCDDDPKRFRERVGKLAVAKPKEEKPKENQN